MSLLKFILFSSLEYLSSFVFILVQFRFSIKENIEKILLISVLLSFVSYSFVNAGFESISPLAQNIILLIYIWMVLKVSVPNSFIMLLTGYTVFGLVQTCFAAIFYAVGWIAGELQMGTSMAYTVSVCSSVMMTLISVLTYYGKGGFSFIGTRGRVNKKRITGKSRWFIGYILFAFIVTLVANIYMLSNQNPPYLLLAFVLMCVLVILFYLTFKRDESVD